MSLSRVEINSAMDMLEMCIHRRPIHLGRCIRIDSFLPMVRVSIEEWIAKSLQRLCCSLCGEDQVSLVRWIASVVAVAEEVDRED